RGSGRGLPLGHAGAGDAEPGSRRAAPAHGASGPGRRAVASPAATRRGGRHRPGRGRGARPTRHRCGKPRPGLLDVPGMKPGQVASFFEAAAAFFAQAPWKQVGYETAIRVAWEEHPSGPWYAVLMGQSGLAAGLAQYEDLESLRGILAIHEDYQSNARQSVATTVIFSEEVDLPLAD